MMPMYMPMKVKDKVNSFLCLHNDISKNLLLTNVVAFNMLRNDDDDDDDVNLGKAIPMVLTIDGTWIQHAQYRSWSTRSSKSNIQFVGSPTVHWEGYNSSIQSVIEVNEHFMESLFDKLSNRSGCTTISHRKGLQTIMTSCCFCREPHRHH
jgi:hypothetical protein